MSVELKVPSAGESIAEVYIGRWHKSEGDRVTKGDTLVELETDKATLELPAPVSGTLTQVLTAEGETVAVGAVVAYLEEGEGPQAGEQASDRTGNGEEREEGGQEEQGQGEQGRGEQGQEEQGQEEAREGERLPEVGGAAQESPSPAGPEVVPADQESAPPKKQPHVMPAARRALAESGVRAGEIEATGPGNRLLKEDVLAYRERPYTDEPKSELESPSASNERQDESRDDGYRGGVDRGEGRPDHDVHRGEERVPMSPIRLRIAERLVEAQQTAALLTTMNEIDMTQVVALRHEHQDAFQDKYGVKLGFMSFFVKAVVEALKRIPQVNAEIRGTDIIYRNYYDIGIAVGGGKGLVAPVLRNAERLGFAEIEVAIGDFARRARENKLTVEELQGGTFTISNGGIYGSLLSTPIVNPPQSGILGLHAIQDRPVARDGAVVIRKMMYVALTYDHRIVDGREAVTFLKRIKEVVEDPARMLLEV